MLGYFLQQRVYVSGYVCLLVLFACVDDYSNPMSQLYERKGFLKVPDHSLDTKHPKFSTVLLSGNCNMGILGSVRERMCFRSTVYFKIIIEITIKYNFLNLQRPDITYLILCLSFAS